MPVLTLSKHQALGNDFLVAFDDQPLPPDLPALARWLCDRRRGVGADGLIIAVTTPAAGHDVGMVLHNADGSRAEMSGNGIRCLAQAWARRHGVATGTVTVATDAGTRVVTVRPAGERPREIEATVSMGPVTAIDPPGAWAAVGIDPLRPVAHLSLGNPHTVVAVDDVDAVDLAAVGALVPDVNIEIVEPGPERHAVTMRVHERGAGITEACGTGACAAAFAAASWGLATPLNGEITVHMVGGDAKVGLGDEAALTGPAVHVAEVGVEL